MKCAKCKTEQQTLIIEAMAVDDNGEIIKTWVNKDHPICKKCEATRRRSIIIPDNEKIYFTTVEQLSIFDEQIKTEI